MRYRTPSVSRIMAELKLDREEVKQIASFGKMAYLPSEGLFGPEVVYAPDGCTPAFVYLNTGDTYSPCLVHTGKSIILTTLGDYIETQERRGRRFY